MNVMTFCGKKRESMTVREIYLISEGSELISDGENEENIVQ
jgi:hypothetical protein